MNNQPEKQSIGREVMEKIKTGEVKSKPKFYFVLKGTLFVLGAAFALILSIFLVSFILFSLRASGGRFLLGFGFQGLRFLFVSLPWLLFFVGSAFILIVEVFAQHFEFSWRKPALYSVLGILVFILITGFLVAITPMHEGLFVRAQENRLPLAGALYRRYGLLRSPYMHVGKVEGKIDKGFQIENLKGQKINIIVYPKTRFPSGKDIERNDLITVVGKRRNSTVGAFGIHKIKKDQYPGLWRLWKFKENSNH